VLWEWEPDSSWVDWTPVLWDWAPVESGRVDDLLWLVSDEVLVQVSARECEAMQWSFEDVVVHVYVSMKGAGAKDACCCW
jgi:hypothetical protein